MKVDSGAAPPTGWARQRERSNRWAVRLMRWLALALGRRAARVLLHPIAAWFVLDGETRRHSARYLSRALGRPATWGDVYRHLFTFSATVLDRVYLLQERFDEFRFQASGAEAILAPFARGDGVLAFGAHLGSFEALRMIGHEKGLRVAVIMYEDNARFINEALAALAPKSELRTIALGRVDAMLALRRWLDEGGVAGLLADRTLAANSQRSKAIALPFLGAPGAVPRRSVPPRGDAAPARRLHGRPLPRRPRLRSALHRDRRLRRARRERHGDCRRARCSDPGRTRTLRCDARGAVPRGAVQLVQLL